MNETPELHENAQEVTAYLFATIGSLTQRGGRVTTASSGAKISGLSLALVGDVVTYEDGSEAVITDGAGGYAIWEGKSFALEGSHLSNGDIIIESLQKHGKFKVYKEDPPKGLFDSSYVPPRPEPSRRLAVRGATTSRGGVLKKPTSGWNSSAPHGEPATIGDLIHYADGSTARIIEGLSVIDNPNFKPLAFVGAALDNGDIITDSPEREPSICTHSFVVVRSTSVGESAA